MPCSSDILMGEGNMAKQHPAARLDNDIEKGAVEAEAPAQSGHNTHAGIAGQLPHRPEDPNIKGHDTDFPEPGENAEHSGEVVKRKPAPSKMRRNG